MGENASDALKMAAAILLFVMALSVAIFAFSKARYSAEKAMENLDGTFLFYDSDNIYLDYITGGNKKNTKIQINQQSIIDKSQFIVNLFNYYTSGYTLLFYYVDSGDLELSEVDGARVIKLKSGKKIKKLTLYYSEANDRSLNTSILRVNPQNYELNKDGSAKDALVNKSDYTNEYRAIYGLDITDEISRQEPWIYNDAFINKFVEDLVMAYIYKNQAVGDTNAAKSKAQAYTRSAKSKLNLNEFQFDGAEAYRYWFKYAYLEHTNNKSFMDQDCRFIQRIGTYNYESSSTIHSDSPLSEEDIEDILSGQQFNGISSLTDVDASEDLLTNGETIDNYGGTEKKIVQYIYIGETNIYG